MPRRDPWTFIGLFAFFALLFLALFGERIAPHEAIYFVPEHGRDPRPYDPGLIFPFGSDILGRDLFSLVLAGARMTLVIVVLSGIARVLAGVLLAAIAGWWPIARLASDSLAELVAAVPATLIALLAVKVFVRGDTSFVLFVLVLLITGWAGPYRIFRAEVDRLARMEFTEGAHALGLGRARLFLRHHVPHLVPLLAVNAAQQSVASLVALAELGVLGVFVGATRLINIEESLSVVRTGQVNSALISDPPEWGGLLANARTIESLWTTRWLFLVPGVSLAVAAVGIAAVGLGISRRYARRSVYDDLRGPGAAAIGVACVVMILAAGLVPERYAAAREWADTARAAVRAGGDVQGAFAAAGLRPLGASYAVERDVAAITRTGSASVRVGSIEYRETSEGTVDVRSFVYVDSGGGRVDAPLVFASWGISPRDFPTDRVGVAPDFAMTVHDWPDDYAGLEVRGKIVVLLRFTGIATGRGNLVGPDVPTTIANALKRGASAVVLVDPTLAAAPRVSTNARANLYQRFETELPVRSPSGPPVIVVSSAAGDALLGPSGVVPSRIYADLDLGVTSGLIGVTSGWLDSAGEFSKRSIARDLGTRAQLDVPLALTRAHVRSLVGESPGVADGGGRVLIWAVARATTQGGREADDVVAAVARAIGGRGAPLIFVSFDPSVDPGGNAVQVADLMRGRRVDMVIVIDDVVGPRLAFRSAYGDLIPAFDLYADRAGAAHAVTRGTVNPNVQPWSWPGSAPFIQTPAVIVTGEAGAGDPRGDAAATIGYLAGRLALGAEELRR